ncbi:MAG: phenylalanine--tRNA ligase subunit beta [Oscillospiraceae bacterium]|nr:phenylalanine--tRNA ligase subunit beta [Oscillospiraceae bacterium]
MFVSMNWIQEFVDLKKHNILDLIHRFTLSTAEVEDIIIRGDNIKDVVVGEIIEINAHTVKLDCGNKIFNCVCNAPNLKLGMKVPFAKAGSLIPKGKIETCIISGHESEGMCCSEADLGISDDNTGIMVIDNFISNGIDIKDIYCIDDIIFEVDNKSLTNRPDLWGHYGIAREFAALTEQSIKPLPICEIEDNEYEEVNVDVLARDLVYRYSALKVSGISKNISPVNMRIRLYYCGMRAINLVADLTNYIMLETGQPMHAFDAEFIQHIVVDTPKTECKFVTLDKAERSIDTSMLMIYNEKEPVAIAGIMGGLYSEIKDNTESVVLESANFDGVSVRKTSSKLGLRTDASMRYEKILDPELTLIGIKRFVYLLKHIDNNGFVSSKLADKYVKKYDEISIQFDKHYVDRYTGINISTEQIEKTLSLLGFSVSEDEDNFTVIVPSFRGTKDVTIKADIIEEITRIYGYDNFEIKPTYSKLQPVKITNEKKDEYTIKDLLISKYFMNEVHSYIWCDSRKYKKIGIDALDNVRILNMPPENGTIRNSMLPTLLSFVYENRSYAEEFSIFEIGRVVDGLKENGLCNERKKLGVVFYSKIKSEKDLYFKCIDIIKDLMFCLKHADTVFKKTKAVQLWQHPVNTSEILILGKTLGFINTLHPNVIEKIDKNAAIICFEIDFNKLEELSQLDIKFNEPSKFPNIEYDISINIKEDTRYEDIKIEWEKLNIEIVSNVQVIDVYKTKDINSMTIRFTFNSKEKTLSLEEVQNCMDKIISNLNDNEIKLR